MKNLTFHIVGLTHNDVKGHEVEYAKEAEGRTICLVPDDANTFDMLAVKAYDKQQLIGYVSALEGEDVRGPHHRPQGAEPAHPLHRLQQ